MCETLNTFEHRRYAGYGLELAADIGGPPLGQPVVLLHGGGQTRHAWGTTASRLVDQGCFVVALDLRGHGQSAWSKNADYSLTAFAEDLRAVLRALPAPPVLIGASLGGMSALLAAGEQPQAPMAGLVLVDIVPRIRPEGARAITRFMGAAKNGFASLHEAADAIAAYLPHRPRPPSPKGLEKNLRQMPDGRYHWHWDPNFILVASQEEDDARTERLEAAARQVTCPALIVRGGKSEIVTAEGVRALHALMPHAEIVNVAEANHMVAGDQNDIFDDAIVRFLKANLSH